MKTCDQSILADGVDLSGTDKHAQSSLGNHCHE